MLGGVENLYGQEKQLENTKRLGFETHDIMRNANKDLRDQRNVIEAVSDKNIDIVSDLDMANKRVRQMSMREFFYRLALNITVFLLIIAIIVVIVVRVTK